MQLWHFGSYSPCWEFSEQRGIRQVFHEAAGGGVARIWRANISFLGFTKGACNIPTAASYSVNSSMCWKIAGDTKFANTLSLSRPSRGKTATKLSKVRFQWSHSFEASARFRSVSRRSGRSTLSVEIADQIVVMLPPLLTVTKTSLIEIAGSEAQVTHN